MVPVPSIDVFLRLGNRSSTHLWFCINDGGIKGTVAPMADSGLKERIKLRVDGAACSGKKFSRDCVGWPVSAVCFNQSEPE